MQTNKFRQYLHNKYQLAHVNICHIDYYYTRVDRIVEHNRRLWISFNGRYKRNFLVQKERRAKFSCSAMNHADPSGRAVQDVGLWQIACWECGFESCRGHICLSSVIVVCCQVEVSATG
jgi:hypothetical protein